MLIETFVHDPIFFFRVVIVLIFSITLHELAHGLVAISLGDDTPKKRGHITLNPLVHMGWQSIILLFIAGISWGQTPVNSSKFRFLKLGTILVFAAGPALNLALSLLILYLIKSMQSSTLVGIFSVKFLYIAAHLNMRLFLLNLLPIPPLDGFYVFNEIFPKLKPLEKTHFGLFALVLLFSIPAFAESLAVSAAFIIQSIMSI